MKKKKHTPWPRWAKVTRNLLFALLLGLTAWNQYGKPLPYGADLRRFERQHLIPKTQCVAELTQRPENFQPRIGWADGVALAYSFPSGPYARHVAGEAFRLTGDTEMIVLRWPIVRFNEAGRMRPYAAYIVFQPPADSETASLTLHNNDGTFTVESRKDNGIFLFFATLWDLDPEQEWGGDLDMDDSWFYAGEFAYELTFYDGSGMAVGEMEG